MAVLASPAGLPAGVHCGACGFAWNDQLPAQVPLKQAVAGIMALRCTSCGAGPFGLWLGPVMTPKEMETNNGKNRSPAS